MKFDWDCIAKELETAGAKGYEIEEARLCFERGLRLLLKMYFDYEAGRSSQKIEGKKSCHDLYKDVA